MTTFVEYEKVQFCYIHYALFFLPFGVFRETNKINAFSAIKYLTIKEGTINIVWVMNELFRRDTAPSRTHFYKFNKKTVATNRTGIIKHF